MKCNNRIRAGLMAVLGGLVLSGCASTRDVPITVQSEPLGAHVLYQVRGVGTGDWVYLGTTPVEVNRQISKRNLRNADAFVLRLVSEGYNDQTREWSGAALELEVEDKGRVFWNPRLIKSE
jgi:hypothetical protein